MKVERRYTTAGSDPYAGIAFVERTSRIVNPDGSVVFEATVTAPEAWSQVAVDILAQKYCRKAGVARSLRPVSEDGVPEWLQRHEPDDAALAELPAEERTGGETDARAGLPPPRRLLDLLGRHQRLLRGRGRARVLRRAAGHAGAAGRGAELARSGSTPACTGRTASPARRRATGTATGRRDAAPLDERVRAARPARLLHPVRGRRPRERGRHHGPVDARGPRVQVRLGHRLQLLGHPRRRASACRAAAARPAS